MQIERSNGNAGIQLVFLSVDLSINKEAGGGTSM
jgi:hypothetical protein